MSADAVQIWCSECDEGELTVEVYPGEPMVRYYADGSGYPGSPAEVEVVAQTCECPVDHETVRDRALDRHAEVEQMEEDRYWDARIDEHRERECYGA